MLTRFSGSATEEQEKHSASTFEKAEHLDVAVDEQLSPTILKTSRKNRGRASFHDIDRQNNTPTSRRSSTQGKHDSSQNGGIIHPPVSSVFIGMSSKKVEPSCNMSEFRRDVYIRPRHQGPWSISTLTLVTTAAAIVFLSSIVFSFSSRQLDPKGCRMSYMRPSFVKLSDFDTEHTYFASKYSTYLYREGGIDDDTKVRGVPILFIPGNAGSYKQVRPIAAEAANYFHQVLRHDPKVLSAGVRKLDFFTVDFNEDITAFHGRTLLDQAEYLNEAIAYILSLYHDPRRSDRPNDLPDPTSVIILGHSMGGIVARTMLVMNNYQTNSINTIITMSAPHARPPVSFDNEIVVTYRRINKYWRDAYSQKWANNNPLWHVTLISIAGGGLDTVVPSDYASLESLVPETHGFTVFTSTVPFVWTGMDHQAILWCDQFRKVVVRSLYDIIDVNRPTQTKPRADRMRSFKKHFLTGMENFAEKTFAQNQATSLLTLDDKYNTVLSQGERLIVRGLGQNEKIRTHLIPISPQGIVGGKRFILLTNRKLLQENGSGDVEVLMCAVFVPRSGRQSTLFPLNMEFSGTNMASPTQLACKNAEADVISIPASKNASSNPYYLDGEAEKESFSYLQYNIEDIVEFQFVAVIDKATGPNTGWILAEFFDIKESHQTSSISLGSLLAFGMKLTLPSNRPLVSEIKIPALHSSLLAYTLEMRRENCVDNNELFAPILRQYISEPHESKYFVNFQKVNINLHGASPFMPPPLNNRDTNHGLSLQFWTNPICNSNLTISLKIDILGSLGKLYMRYRTVFAAFPLLVVALVLRKQFKLYDETGIFTAFSESLDLCLRQSLPFLLLALTLFSLALSQISSASRGTSPSGLLSWKVNETGRQTDFMKNDLLIGSKDPFFCLIIPLIGLICVGVCVMVNYATLFLTNVLAIMHNWLSLQPVWLRNDERKKLIPLTFSPSSPRRRLITTVILLFLVSTFIPYQFAYLVACLVQIATCTKALRILWDSPSSASTNFFNYAHSILILMLWILPINLPILVVWIHNLAVHWLTPFSSHHNLLSIMPFILLVETLTGGKMIPRINSKLRHLTNVFLFYIAVCAAMYGMTYAYMLHHLVNLLTAWLVTVHFSYDNTLSLAGLYVKNELENVEKPDKERKTP
ncbi:GPI inositol-deacylase [Golovinomyces cichoracearum]|uniref:GPI inositol-deacylase n=1 Tax=Golovinomyces cichoracearum TaxID=62708 RepID=A0A420IC62_9PEZI|nr:GPI inositol-deacylase [Golovinomyces cichoracearum]